MELDPTTEALPARPVTVRWRAALAAARARLEARRAQALERRALAELGWELARTAAAPGGSGGTSEAHRAAESLQAEVEATEADLSRSFQEDRADYAGASSWIRPVVIVRGIAARAVVRDRLRRLRRARAEAWARLGAVALDALPADGPAPRTALNARRARSRVAAAAAEEERLLAPYGGHLVPPGAHHVGREVAGFGRHLLKEVRGALIPRLPALAGLAVGWWIAATFTDSSFSAWLNRVGIGHGPRRAVSSGTYRAMTFWLPLAAAALCSYAAARLGTLVRARYALPRRVVEGACDARDDRLTPREGPVDPGAGLNAASSRPREAPRRSPSPGGPAP